MTKHELTRMLIFLVSAAMVATTECRGDVVLSDQEFLDADWSVSSRAGPNTEPISTTAARESTAGNPGAYRRIQHTVTATESGFAFGWFWHLNSAQSIHHHARH